MSNVYFVTTKNDDDIIEKKNKHKYIPLLHLLGQKPFCIVIQIITKVSNRCVQRAFYSEINDLYKKTHMLMFL